MKKTIVILSVLFASCSNGDAPKVNKDSINTKAVVDTPNRYFLISYEVRSKDYTENYTGCMYQWGHTFPTKHEIENYVYPALTRSRDCYQKVIVQNIFEFKSKSDYDMFMIGFEDDKISKNKNPCK